ncbi:hypothetical protein BDV59DRAFT_167650 [Aspergillus ambiguus]|uniref:uncharacterized protein n=1 Tax=Aspergillus ambiguus TaxID=176160 RepID=UPI003CCDEDED
MVRRLKVVGKNGRTVFVELDGCPPEIHPRTELISGDRGNSFYFPFLSQDKPYGVGEAGDPPPAYGGESTLGPRGCRRSGDWNQRQASRYHMLWPGLLRPSMWKGPRIEGGSCRSETACNREARYPRREGHQGTGGLDGGRCTLDVGLVSGLPLLPAVFRTRNHGGFEGKSHEAPVEHGDPRPLTQGEGGVGNVTGSSAGSP